MMFSKTKLSLVQVQRVKLKRFFVTVSMFFALVSGYGQTVPFGSNNTYSYGYIAAGSADATATSWYNSWKSNFVKDCSPNGKLIVYNAGGNNGYSEGQGYGMLLAAYNGDQALFNDLWKLYKLRSNGNGLMHWDVNCTGNNQSNGATDGDLDAAMALLIAEKQWPTATSPYDYGAEATTLITNIYNHETNLTGNTAGAPSCTGADGNPLAVLRPGDAFTISTTCTCINLSYFAPAYYRAFAQHVPSQASEWTRLAADSYKLINWNKDAGSHLVTAWTRANGTVPTPSSSECSYSASGGGGPSSYQYDAARTPWRIATDYLWWGTAAADTWLTQVGGWANGVGAANIVDGYNHNGTAYSTYKNSAFTGAFALAQMAITQGQTDSWYTYWSTKSSKSGYGGSDKLDDAPYFQNSLATMYMFLATGNFWNPYNGTCLQPDLGTDLSTCTGTTLPVNLASNTTDPGASVDYTWYRNGVVISGQTGPNCTGCGTVTGTYVVVRDSTGGCTKRDTLLISGTIPTPTLTGPLALCNPATYNLTPTNVASFPGGTTYQWSVDLTGGTSYSTLTGETATTLSNVRSSGRYRLTATAGACNNNGNVLVTSTIPTPVDGCSGSAGNVNLSIVNPNLNGTNYNWYTTAAGSTLATTVPVNTATNTTGITVNVASTTTYYVQDMSAVNGNVGPTALSFGASTNWGCTDQHNLAFTASSNFTLKSFYFRGEYNNSNPSNVTIEILNSANTVVATFMTDNNTTHPSSGESLQRYTFNGGSGVTIDAATWGSNLKMRLKSNTCTDVQAKWTAGGASYPYVSAGSIVTITGANTNGSANTADYHFFYNWEISTGSSCARIPVIAKIGGSCVSAPVELISFTGEKGEGRTILNWITASEVNNDYFNIERSVDGVNFETIGTMDGMGTKTGVTVYSYADENTPSGKAYYRLTQVDFDGTNTSSPIVAIEHMSITMEVQVAPNPFEHSTQILVNTKEQSKAKVKITDLSGRLLYETTITTNEIHSVGEEIPSGVYLIHVFSDNLQKIRKIVKQ